MENVTQKTDERKVFLDQVMFFMKTFRIVLLTLFFRTLKVILGPKSVSDDFKRLILKKSSRFVSFEIPPLMYELVDNSITICNLVKLNIFFGRYNNDNQV